MQRVLHMTQRVNKSSNRRTLDSLRTLAAKARDEHQGAVGLKGPERTLHILRRHQLLRELAGTVASVEPTNEECALAIDALSSYETLFFSPAQSREAVEMERTLGQRLSRLASFRPRARTRKAG
jgi:hypothetical protein